MKYQQPFGVSDPNAPYINGNPSTGQTGSIPPAASIEYPQREIVALIAAAGLQTPADSDLAQLARAVQSLLMNSRDDAGTANAYQVTLAPAPTAYYRYVTVIMRVGNTNTGPSVLNVNALGAKNIVRIDGSPLVGGDMRAGQIVCLVYDGANFQLVWAGGAVAGMPIYLTAARTFYVNAAAGNDSYDGTSANFTSGAHGPFQSMQRASNEVIKYNLNGYNITVNVADGSYNNVSLGMVAGAGKVFWIGNPANPANVIINGDTHTAIWAAYAGVSHDFDGFKVTSAGTPAANELMSGIMAANSTTINIRNFNFGLCKGAHMVAAYQSMLSIDGTITISGDALGSGGASVLPGCHIYASTQSEIQVQYGAVPPNFVIPGAVTMGSAFIRLDVASMARVFYGTLTGAANVTGKRYQVSTNSISNAGGGATYYPGTVAGTVDTQGQYI